MKALRAIHFWICKKLGVKGYVDYSKFEPFSDEFDFEDFEKTINGKEEAK